MPTEKCSLYSRIEAMLDVIIVCPVGRWVAGQSCEPCPINTYKTTAGNETCSPCGMNRTTLDNEQTSDACGTFNVVLIHFPCCFLVQNINGS